MDPAELLAWLLATITAELDQSMGSALVDRAMQHAKNPEKAPAKVQALFKHLTVRQEEDAGPAATVPGAAGTGR